MEKIKILAPLFFVVGISVPALGQETMLLVPGVNVHLGMSQAEVMSKFEKKPYKLAPIPEPYPPGETWFMREEGGVLPIGHVKFEAGKLIRAVKESGSFKSPDSVRLVKTLFYILKELNDKGKNVADIVTSVSVYPDGTFTKVTLFLGEREVIVRTWEGIYGELPFSTAEIWERLERQR